LPPAPGRVERREFEYVRHGTTTFILNRDVVTGQIVAPSHGPTRTEEDFVAHLQRTVATDPAASRWHVVVEHLNIHQSEALVRYVAAVSGLADGHCQVKPFGRRRRSERGERSVHRRPDPACTSASDGQNWLGVGRFRSVKT